jgi:hypothetical protein
MSNGEVRRTTTGVQLPSYSLGRIRLQQSWNIGMQNALLSTVMHSMSSSERVVPLR